MHWLNNNTRARVGTRKQSEQNDRFWTEIRDYRAALIDVVVTDDTVSGPEILGNLESGGNSQQWSAKEQGFSEQVNTTCHKISTYESNPFTKFRQFKKPFTRVVYF